MTNWTEIRALVGEAGARVAAAMAADGHAVVASDAINSSEGRPPGLMVVFHDAAGEIGFAEFAVYGFDE